MKYVVNFTFIAELLLILQLYQIGRMDYRIVYEIFRAVYPKLKS
jgi:hypothetical protein